jgi:hypothetical protein
MAVEVSREGGDIGPWRADVAGGVPVGPCPIGPDLWQIAVDQEFYGYGVAMKRTASRHC